MKTILAKSRAGYVVVIERTRTGYSAYGLDMPGCVTTNGTLEGTKRRAQFALYITPVRSGATG